MSSDFTPEFRTELLDDFYAECDEHLSNLRQQLTALEPGVASGSAAPAALESAFRSMHSFKGNAAIVGLRSAEELAHAAETVLRGLSQGTLALAASHLETLGDVIHRLEQIVSAHRQHQSLPDTSDLLAALPSRSPVSGAQPPPVATAAAVEGKPTPAAELQSAQARRLLPWRCLFSPSQELDRRGININVVRSRLTELGEIVTAVPSIQPNGAMRFDFSLALREPPADVDRWAADGMVLQPADPAATSVSQTAAPEPHEPAPTAASASLFVSPSHIVRVDLGRLDELMRIAGEMVIHRSRLDERIGHANGERAGLQEISLALGRSLRELREAITRVRLVAVGEIFTRMPFLVRDLARETGKRVRLVLEGEHTEIDKYLVERLKEPLLHLVRNAVSHGIETPAERLATGKPEEATLRLAASTVGHAVIIQIQDDGRGIDAAAVRAKAATLGIRSADAADDDALLRVLCQPGFSTRDDADLAAGRGVGMAVVANTLRELGGSLSLDANPGRGAQFTLRLPLTLSIAEVFIVTAATHTCAVPQDRVEEIITITEAQVRTLQQVEVISYRDGLLPIVRLRAMFGTARAEVSRVPVLVLGADRGCVGLVVDRVQGQREVVVRAMQDPLLQVPGVSGATELGNGRAVLILDPDALTRGAVRPRHPAAANGTTAKAATAVA